MNTSTSTQPASLRLNLATTQEAHDHCPIIVPADQDLKQLRHLESWPPLSISFFFTKPGTPYSYASAPPNNFAQTKTTRPNQQEMSRMATYDLRTPIRKRLTTFAEVAVTYIRRTRPNPKVSSFNVSSSSPSASRSLVALPPRAACRPWSGLNKMVEAYQVLDFTTLTQ